MSDLGSIINRIYEDVIAGLDIKSKRIAWLVGVLLLLFAIIFSLWVYETVSGTLYFYSLQKKIELLEKLHVLSTSGIATDTDLYPVFQTTLKEVDAWKVIPLRVSLFGEGSIFGWLGEFIAGSWLGLTFALILFLTDRKKPLEKRQATVFYVFLSLGIIGGILSLFFATGYDWILMPVIPTLAFIILGLIVNMANARKK